VRPHLLDITYTPNGKASFRARVEHVNPAGPVVKVELRSEWGQPVLVELPPERFRDLSLVCGADVVVTPKDMRLFVDDYAI